MKKVISLVMAMILSHATFYVGMVCSEMPRQGAEDAEETFELIGNIDKINFNEPSDIVFHAQRKTLFVVGDEGDICEIKKDGTLIKKKHIRDADFEGITYDASTGLLYVVIEGQEKILEIDPEDFKVWQEFSVERTFEGDIVLKSGGDGLEALTFIPDPAHPEGGTFYAANQSFDLNNKEEPSAIFELNVPIISSQTKDANIMRFFSIGVIDLAALYYDEETGHIFVLSDTAHTIFEITRDGKIVRSYDILEKNAEGLAVDDEGYIYIARDSGGIIKYKWNRVGAQDTLRTDAIRAE